MLTRFIGSKRYWDDLDNADRELTEAMNFYNRLSGNEEILYADRELLLRGAELHVRICKEKFDKLFNMTLIEKMRYKG